MSQEQELERQKNLAQERESNGAATQNENQTSAKSKSSGENSSLADNAKPTSTLSLIRLIKFSDVFFFLAILVAIAKDYLDFIGVGSLPLIGTLITLMTSITIFFAMLFCGSHSSFGSKKKMKLKIMKWFSLITGTGVEMFFFGVNFAPIETATACTAYTLILMERKDEAEGSQNSKEVHTKYLSQMNSVQTTEMGQKGLHGDVWNDPPKEFRSHPAPQNKYPELKKSNPKKNAPHGNNNLNQDAAQDSKKWISAKEAKKRWQDVGGTIDGKQSHEYIQRERARKADEEMKKPENQSDYEKEKNVKRDDNGDPLPSKEEEAALVKKHRTEILNSGPRLSTKYTNEELQDQVDSIKKALKM